MRGIYRIEDQNEYLRYDLPTITVDPALTVV